MQFSTNMAAALAIFSSVVAAAPAAAPVSDNKASPAVVFEKRASINNCDYSNFINRTSGGSPKVADCRQITYNIAGGGTWTVDGLGKGHHQLVQYGTCAFGVQIADSGYFGEYKVGNQDIIDLINDSIRLYQWNGLIGSEGITSCQRTMGGMSEVKWGLYHD